MNGSLQSAPTHYALDTATGKITFVTAPGGPGSGGQGPSGEDLVTVTAEFDVPVRFDTDHLELSAEAADDQAEAASAPRIPIVELKPAP